MWDTSCDESARPVLAQVGPELVKKESFSSPETLNESSDPTNVAGTHTMAQRASLKVESERSTHQATPQQKPSGCPSRQQGGQAVLCLSCLLHRRGKARGIGDRSSCEEHHSQAVAVVGKTHGSKLPHAVHVLPTPDTRGNRPPCTEATPLCLAPGKPGGICR